MLCYLESVQTVVLSGVCPDCCVIGSGSSVGYTRMWKNTFTLFLIL